MIQKLLNIGSSRGVSLPAKELEDFGFETNGEVEVLADKTLGGFVVRPKRGKISQEFVDWTSDFIEKYGPALKELADK